jgi:hypothetical protein
VVGATDVAIIDVAIIAALALGRAALHTEIVHLKDEIAAASYMQGRAKHTHIRPITPRAKSKLST